MVVVAHHGQPLPERGDVKPELPALGRVMRRKRSTETSVSTTTESWMKPKRVTLLSSPQDPIPIEPEPEPVDPGDPPSELRAP
jgi:hypothetical protein